MLRGRHVFWDGSRRAMDWGHGHFGHSGVWEKGLGLTDRSMDISIFYITIIPPLSLLPIPPL
jgi:hypothetical protein